MEKISQPYHDDPRTGVGTPDEHAEAGGVELGGDTGDVGTPRMEIGGSFGGTSGTHATPQSSTVWEGGGEPLRERRRKLRGE
ncbi:MAG: hypothetical protein ACYDBB_05310 [Armatimonadota bacterium]